MERSHYLFFPRERVVGIESCELALPQAGEVRIRTRCSLVSPGTELAFFEGRHSTLHDTPPDAPRAAPGYSSVALVEAVGEATEGLRPGDRVACMGGHVDRTNTPAAECHKVPDGLRDEQAVFMVLGSIALHGVRTASPLLGETALVLGLGAIGQVAVRLLRLVGLRAVLAADVFPMRLEKARQGGADRVLRSGVDSLLDAVRETTNGRGCELVLDTTGNPGAVADGLAAAAPGGRVVLLGSPHGQVTLDLYSLVHRRDVRLMGAHQMNCPDAQTISGPWTKRRNRELILEYVAAGRLDFESLITHRALWSDAQRVYDALSTNKESALTAVFGWPADEREAPYTENALRSPSDRSP